MEYIFDIATHTELVELLGEDELLDGPNAEPFSFDRRTIKASSDLNAALLAQLYSMRGNLPQAEKHLAAIKDEQLRLDYGLLIQDLASAQ